jgi:hypothetical protein
MALGLIANISNRFLETALVDNFEAGELVRRSTETLFISGTSRSMAKAFHAVSGKSRLLSGGQPVMSRQSKSAICPA